MIGDQVYRKVTLRVVLVLAGFIVLSSIDRVNVSFAALEMNGDIGLDAAGYGLGASLFFVGYLLFQLPSAAVLRRIGARWWIAGSVVGWGTAATLMAFITAPWEFFVLRVMLGAFESGFAPGVVWYVSQWLPQAYRGRSIGLTLLAIPTSVVVGGPLCGFLMSLGHDGFAGWRLMFLVEGLVTVAAGVAALLWFVDRPSQARWLSDAQRDWIDREVGREQAVATTGATAPRSVARDPILWLSAVIWFVLITGANAIIFWLPIAIKSFGQDDPLIVGLLSALPWAAIGAGMFLNARHSDRTGERYRHIGLATLLGAAGVAGAAFAGGGVASLILLMIGGFGLGGAQSVFWTVPTRFLGARNPQAIATINLFGNASGVIAPTAIGWIVAQSGSIIVPVQILAVLLLVGAMVVIPLRRIAEARIAAQDA